MSKISVLVLEDMMPDLDKIFEGLRAVRDPETNLQGGGIEFCKFALQAICSLFEFLKYMDSRTTKR